MPVEIRSMRLRRNAVHQNVQHLICARAVTFENDGEVVLATPPPGWLYRVDGIIIRTVTAWDGTGADLDVGYNGTGGDADGFWDGSAGGMASVGYYGEASGSYPTGLGAKIYDSTLRRKPAFVLAAQSNAITATVTPGTSATTGRSIIHVFGLLLENIS